MAEYRPPGSLSGSLVVVPGDNVGPARDKRAHRCQPGSRQPEHGIAFAAKGGGDDHLSFSVERPASASTRLMIQKRMTKEIGSASCRERVSRYESISRGAVS